MRALLLVLAAIAAASPAETGEVYRWRDAAGVVHFTDDPSKVPPGARPVRAHPENLIVMERPSGTDEAKGGADGEALFARRCAKCHVLFPEEDPKKEPLLEVLTDPDTHAPRPLEEVVKTFRWAADGRFSDMDDIEISDEDLRRIAQALRARLR